MSIIRDLTLVIGGGLIALAFQPAMSIGQSALAPHANNLAAIAKVMSVDKAGNIQIRSNGQISIRARTLLDLRADAQARLVGALTIIGGGNPAPALNTSTTILCPAPGARCIIQPNVVSVLIGR